MGRNLIMLFGLTSSSRLFFSQRFSRLILRPSSGLSRTREFWNFEPNPLLFRGYHVLIPLRPLLQLLLNAVAAAAASIEAAAAAATAAAIALSSSSSNGLNGIRTWYPRNNKGLGSKFQNSRVRDKPEEGRSIRRPKRCEKNNLDEEVSPKSIINENTSSQKYTQLLGRNLVNIVLT